MSSLAKLGFICAFAAIGSIPAICSATLYTDRASWDAAIQAFGYSEVSVSFADPSAWHTNSYSVGNQSYAGLTSNQASNGMSVMIDNSSFEFVASQVSIQNDALVDSEQGSGPARDTSFSFGQAAYAFGGDYILTCGHDPIPCASSTSFTGAKSNTAGPNSSGFWGIVVSPDSGTQEFYQGIVACGLNTPQCYFNYTLSDFDVAVAATPEPRYSGLLTVLGAGVGTVITRRRRKASK